MFSRKEIQLDFPVISHLAFNSNQVSDKKTAERGMLQFILDFGINLEIIAKISIYFQTEPTFAN